MDLADFHPAVAAWFAAELGVPTEVQIRAWPLIRSGRHTLIAAPTGSGKTLAAFLAAIDDLVRERVAGSLPDETRILYISPLKALSNDIQKNLQAPLAGIQARLHEAGLTTAPIQAWVRTGDTPAGERTRMAKQPPHIVVTTPESLYILLTSQAGRRMLASVRTVIVDEIHAIAGSKRGSHLALSLARLDALAGRPLQRIGLSATQKPITAMAAFLSGEGRHCEIIDTGHVRARDLAIEVPGAPLSAVMSHEVWSELYDQLADLIQAHRTTLIFVNTRRLCERAARHLAERLGEAVVTSHHGSLAREHRLDAEQRLKTGQLKALVATSSLELGIDIGEVDLVCQLGSPRAIGAFLQRVGRSGHGVGRLPKGRLFPLTRDDLVEGTALLRALGQGELDHIRVPQAPLDVLAQQIVAEVAAAGEYEEEVLYQLCRSAWPYRELLRARFDQVVAMLAEGYASARGRRGAYLHRDAVNARLRPRRGAKLTAITNGGAIPDQFDYDVIMQPEGLRIGTLNEDFAFESLPGDIFQLGNRSYRVLKVQGGRVYVEDAHGAPPNIPFWFGEAPGRTDELSQAVSQLRAQLAERLEDGTDAARQWLMDELGLTFAAADQLTFYLATAKVALGELPTQDHLVLERFFDEVGDMHLVIHAPFGSRLNRAFGLALRKRFCRKFNFELQAAALEDSVVLSLGPTHSFVIEEVPRYLHSDSVREVLTQALLDAPMFGARWRWNASIALAVPRMRGGKRRPAQFQRQDAEDLLSVVFPDQLACFENLSGPREIPEHPLVAQTLTDCLEETMDIEGLERLLRRLEAGEVRISAREMAAPSPLAEEVLNARPYAFLDDAPKEERRTLSIARNGHVDLATAATYGRPDPQAIERVRAEVWPDPRDADELHDALVTLGFLTYQEVLQGAAAQGKLAAVGDWQPWLGYLVQARRATRVDIPAAGPLWVAAERLAEVQCLHPQAQLTPAIPALASTAAASAEQALIELIRSRLEGLGPITAAQLAAPLGLPVSRIQQALAQLEQEGFVLQGRFQPDSIEVQWCERRLLARIQRYTIHRLRAEIDPVTPQDYLRFLFGWQGVEEPGEGVETLAETLAQLEGFAIPAAAWESEILPARLQDYAPHLLDQLLASGRFTWLRLTPPRVADDDKPRQAGTVRQTPIVLLAREHLTYWRLAAPADLSRTAPLSSGARLVLEILEQQGASFFADLVAAAGMLHTQAEAALAELVAWGLVSSDTFNGLRALIAPNDKRPALAPRTRQRRRTAPGVDAAGRWVRLSLPQELPEAGRRLPLDALEHLAWTLLMRYGVVFRKMLEREQHLPPWRDLLYIYHRLEARGEIRGGRFVQQFAGEQFAHPDALAALKQIQAQPKSGRLQTIAAADPLNLVGIITPGPRFPALSGNRILYQDGVPIALLSGGELRWLEAQASPELQWAARAQLLGRPGGIRLPDLRH